MASKSKVDITGGPIVKSVIIYAIPIILGTLVQVGFNAADLMVVGKMGSEVAVASVGAVSPIVNLLINSFVGLSAGVNAVLARCIGGGDERRSSRVINTSIIFSVLFGLVLMGSCMLFSKPLLKVTNCPEDCLDGAVLYLNIYSLSIPFVMLYNFAAAIIRTTGDTRNPFLYNLIAGIANVVLNIVLCLILDSKVAAVAIATSVSQLTGAVLCFIHLLRLDGAIAFNIKRLSFSFRELWVVLKIGIPCAFNSALFSISNLQMHSAINSYGTAATAGNAAATSVESFVGSFTTGFNAATIPFIGQNLGAGNKKRVTQSLVCCLSIAASISFVISTVVYIFREFALGLFLTGGTESLAAGCSRMAHVCRFYIICTTYSVFSSALQAFGYSFIPMMNSIITVFGFRMLYLEYIYPVLDAIEHTIDNVYLCFTISWTLTLIAHFSVFLFVYIRYRRTGRVRKI